MIETCTFPISLLLPAITIQIISNGFKFNEHEHEDGKDVMLPGLRKQLYDTSL